VGVARAEHRRYGRAMRARLLSSLLALVLVASAPPQQLDAAGYEALRAVDLRLATIAHRLVTANAALCRERQPATGAVLHALDQYEPAGREVARRVFGFAAPVAIEAVVPGSPAAAAGLAQNDGVVAIGDRAMPAPTTDNATSATRDAALALLAAEPADAPTRWRVTRGGAERALTAAAAPGCRAAFEVLLGPKLAASSDGRIVQIGVRFFERYTDAEVAVVVAHELAHTVLRHRVRLEAAGVKWGLLAEFGRNRRLFRRTEDEADLLGLHLLRNAGYDPASAPAFWRAHGDAVGGGFFRARTHGSAGARAAALEAEIARLPADAPRPFTPPVLATRDQPLE
jgi:hypothetical protein